MSSHPRGASSLTPVLVIQVGPKVPEGVGHHRQRGGGSVVRVGGYQLLVLKVL
jgi:hypothetical protein